MSSKLRDEIKQTRPFAGLEQEAYLSIGRSWAGLEHELAEVLKPHGITPTQYNVLRILRGAGSDGLVRGEIMIRMITRVPDASRLLERMETAGFIARSRDGEDRRFVLTRITRKGLRVVQAVEESVLSLHRSQFVSVAKDDLRQLVRLLGLVRSSS